LAHPIPFLELGNLHPCPIIFPSVLWCSHNGVYPKTDFTLLLQNLLNFLFWKRINRWQNIHLNFTFIWSPFDKFSPKKLTSLIPLWTYEPNNAIINSPDLLPLLDPVKCQWCQRPWWPPQKATNFFLDIYYIPKI